MTGISGCVQLGFMQRACAIWLYFFIGEGEDKASDAKEIIARMRKMKAGECEMTGSWEYFGSRTNHVLRVVSVVAHVTAEQKVCFHGKAAHLSWNKSSPLRRDDPAVEWNGWASKAIKQEELQDSETFSGTCYPTAASYLVFFSCFLRLALPLLLP